MVRGRPDSNLPNGRRTVELKIETSDGGRACDTDDEGGLEGKEQDWRGLCGGGGHGFDTAGGVQVHRLSAAGKGGSSRTDNKKTETQQERG
ncbi:hypothetical protein PBY51_011071 [Eleginops maclovinus]|uniref:Uncharacterized protein n=1 Tax=Eleginops maclovinus TaxID=56733 RepID=A0AAN7XBF8_ELEMC|nr:hypothetical protein PBY51_011071 [Eleginops maclovinus]